MTVSCTGRRSGQAKGEWGRRPGVTMGTYLTECFSWSMKVPSGQGLQRGGNVVVVVVVVVVVAVAVVVEPDPDASEPEPEPDASEPEPVACSDVSEPEPEPEPEPEAAAAAAAATPTYCPAPQTSLCAVPLDVVAGGQYAGRGKPFCTMVSQLPAMPAGSPVDIFPRNAARRTSWPRARARSRKTPTMMTRGVQGSCDSRVRTPLPRVPKHTGVVVGERPRTYNRR